MVTHYISRGDWFDAGTEAECLGEVVPGVTALFLGTREGIPDEEVCAYDEFEIVTDE